MSSGCIGIAEDEHRRLDDRLLRDRFMLSPTGPRPRRMSKTCGLPTRSMFSRPNTLILTVTLLMVLLMLLSMLLSIAADPMAICCVRWVGACAAGITAAAEDAIDTSEVPVLASRASMRANRVALVASSCFIFSSCFRLTCSYSISIPPVFPSRGAILQVFLT